MHVCLSAQCPSANGGNQGDDVCACVGYVCVCMCVTQSGVAMVHVAAQLGNIELLDSLKSRGANMDLPDAQGRLPAVIVAKVCDARTTRRQHRHTAKKADWLSKHAQHPGNCL